MKVSKSLETFEILRILWYLFEVSLFRKLGFINTWVYKHRAAGRFPDNQFYSNPHLNDLLRISQEIKGRRRLKAWCPGNPCYTKGILTTQRESLFQKRILYYTKGIITTQKESLLHKGNPQETWVYKHLGL